MEKIDACKNGCMLYWKDDIDLDHFKFCGEPGYSRPGSQPPKTPYAVWRYLPIPPLLQRLYASQATAEQMTWHINHQTKEGSMCHPSNAEAWRHFDRTHTLILQPNHVMLNWNLWHVGVMMHDSARDETFAMCAALMWTVNDLPAYGMAFGWSSAGVMECPVCMEHTRAFYLQNGRKACYFDCHIQFLPPDHPYRRNKKAFTKN
ncbi:UNVERIFIED_CONTAM: hypothetical protein Slati_3451100 [Sesamum latifolium]|uniref:Uncharacterized protein n=1 Tax=Sesamum latifolium TaxID=2727402 RepID=A0AAW2UIM3_9LAMI